MKRLCPNCGSGSLFAPRSLKVNRLCPVCGMELNRGEGFFLGPMVLNYSIAAFGFVAPCIVLWRWGVLSGFWATVLAVVGCIALPIALYRLSWSLWLMVYFWFLPDRLPANGDPSATDAKVGD